MTNSPTFYILNSKIPPVRSSVKIAASIEYDSLVHLSSDSPLASRNQFKVAKGKKWVDLLPFADSFHFAISERLKLALEEKGYTGWACFPIEIIDHPEQRYFAFYPRATVGPITNLEAINAYETERHTFDLATWTGSDFFTNAETLLIIAKEEVKTLFEQMKVTNAEWTRY